MVLWKLFWAQQILGALPPNPPLGYGPREIPLSVGNSWSAGGLYHHSYWGRGSWGRRVTTGIWGRCPSNFFVLGRICFVIKAKLNVRFVPPNLKTRLQARLGGRQILKTSDVTKRRRVSSMQVKLMRSVSSQVWKSNAIIWISPVKAKNHGTYAKRLGRPNLHAGKLWLHAVRGVVAIL